jgi:hypothetical protein
MPLRIGDKHRHSQVGSRATHKVLRDAIEEGRA